MKNKKVKKFIVANYLLIWLVIIAVLLVSTISFGAYTYLQYAKRVVSTQSPGGIAYSSNLLLNVKNSETDFPPTYISFMREENEVNTFFKRTIAVCNYPQNDRNNYNKYDIAYDFKCQIVDTDNVLNDYSNFSIKHNGKTYSFTEVSESDEGIFAECIINNRKLETGASNTDNYIISAPKNNLENISLKVSAVPVDNDNYINTSNTYLARMFRFIRSSSSVMGWNGRFSDAFSSSGASVNDKNTKKYSAFNYVISGSGSGDYVLSWDTRYVQIDPVFLGKYSEFNLEKKEDIWSLKMHLGDIEVIELQSGETEYHTVNVYSMQFYRTANIPEDEIYDSSAFSVKNNSDVYVTFSAVHD